MSEMIALQGAKSSLLLTVAPQTPAIVYWGERIEHWQGMNPCSDKPVPQGTLDAAVPLTLNAESGRGLFCSPGISGHRDGRDWAPVFQLVGHQVADNRLQLFCSDEQASLEVRFSFGLEPDSDMLVVNQELINTGSSVYYLDSLNYTLPLPGDATECQSFGGRWCQEWLSHRHSIEHGALLLENRVGRTSQQHSPSWLVGTPGFSENVGSVYGIQLAWSGNHLFRFEVASDGTRYIQAGELLLPGEVRLGSGETYQCPTLYAAYSPSGIDAISQEFHAYIRSRLVQWPEPKHRPVLLNTWEGIYFNHQPEYLMQMASQAAALGIERFVLDDGWFKGRNSEQTALGDWYLDSNKYPDGFNPLIEHVKALGMEFGLWIEPEMISPNSDLYKQNPHWVLKLPGYSPPLGRYQEVLDLQNADAFAYILGRLDEILTQNSIDYLKWDMNRELVQAGHQGLAAIHGQTKALYRLLTEVRQRHPKVEIESCAAGGGRIDMGILAWTHRFWTSDCNDAHERVAIQSGFSTFFPPEIMGAHIGPKQAHTTHRKHSLSFRVAVALFGHLGLELDPLQLSPEVFSELKDLIDLHKRLRPVLHYGHFHRLSLPKNENTQVWQVISEDKHQVVIGVFQIAMPSYGFPARVRLTDLIPDREYLIEVCLSGGYLNHAMKHIPEWMHGHCQVSGDWLNKGGIQIPVMDPDSALILKLQAI